jgi:hypothetical protein
MLRGLVALLADKVDRRVSTWRRTKQRAKMHATVDSSIYPSFLFLSLLVFYPPIVYTCYFVCFWHCTSFIIQTSPHTSVYKCDSSPSGRIEPRFYTPRLSFPALLTIFFYDPVVRSTILIYTLFITLHTYMFPYRFPPPPFTAHTYCPFFPLVYFTGL